MEKSGRSEPTKASGGQHALPARTSGAVGQKDRSSPLPRPLRTAKVPSNTAAICGAERVWVVPTPDSCSATICDCGVGGGEGTFYRFLRTFMLHNGYPRSAHAADRVGADPRGDTGVRQGRARP